MPESIARIIHFSSVSGFPAWRMPRKLKAKVRMWAKSGHAFFKPSTFSFCQEARKGRGFIRRAAATSGETWREVIGGWTASAVDCSCSTRPLQGDNNLAKCEYDPV